MSRIQQSIVFTLASKLEVHGFASEDIIRHLSVEVCSFYYKIICHVDKMIYIMNNISTRLILKVTLYNVYIYIDKVGTDVSISQEKNFHIINFCLQS